ncbi:LysR family transcriptional regulator [Paracoccus saliphilus]|uniref:LysR family transcriptional regulator n=1 Tax=Paracoccus saliphilus TaxID=405559 RepID=UPI000971257B|nr:LysR family transcriptional regulator [Paracoccus saliphilus]
MNITLKQMRYFDAALRTGSIVQAAEEMNISQSSISAAIDLIEGTIGVDLFRRMPAKGIVPTDAGEIVGKRLHLFLEEVRLLESDLLSIAGAPVGSLRIGCFEPAAPLVIPRLLQRIAAEYPSIRIEIVEGDMKFIKEQLADGAIDMALTYDISLPVDMPFLRVFTTYPYALIPNAWELSEQDSVSLDELADLPMIMLDLPESHSFFGNLFASHGIDVNVVHSTKSSSVLRGMVAAGFGFSVLMLCGKSDRDPLNGYAVMPISGSVPTSNFGLAYKKYARRTQMVDMVLESCAILAEQRIYDDLIVRNV